MKRGGAEMMMDTEPRGKMRRLSEKHKRGERLSDNEMISLVGNFTGLLLDADIISVETLAEWTEKIKSGEMAADFRERKLAEVINQTLGAGQIDPRGVDEFLKTVTRERIKGE